MPREMFQIGVIARSHPPVSRWAERVLRPYAVLPEPGPLPAGTVMADHDGVRTSYLGPLAVQLHSGDTAHYRDNLASGRPSVWVAMEGERMLMATVDPYEGESLASDPERIVEALALPDAVVARLARFVEAHHVEERFVKRRRDRPQADDSGRAPRILPSDQGWIKR